ncbi:MAG: adenylyl-sulfate kinase [Candidatus Binatia bacterium]|nr:MAG: adenylyl-sulfate kinase [Candidatus Binatia bacterium]
MADPKSRDIVWHSSTVTREERERRSGHRGCTIWLTGLPASGKSTLANLLEKTLWERGARAYVLDGDNIRHGLNRDLGFSPEDRQENIRRIGEVAKLFTDAGVIVITAFISPYRSDRDNVRRIMREGDFIEVFVDAPLEVCEARDPKGHYKKARAGSLPDFTGVSAPYEAPENPELRLRTDRLSPEECVSRIVAFLEERGYFALSKAA